MDETGRPFDVLIVGAGIAGLAAARTLTARGVEVAILEARNRIGGRIATIHPSSLPLAVELGAEFVHGQPPELWRALERARLLAVEVPGRHWRVHRGVIDELPFASRWQRVVERMSEEGPYDRSFRDFVDERFGDDEEERELKALALRYTEGFNAADASRISVLSLKAAERASRAVSGERMFRLPGGYGRLPHALFAGCDARRLRLLLDTVVATVRWRPGHVEITARSAGMIRVLSAERAIVTLPLGVLQAQPDAPGAVAFVPELDSKLEATRQMVMGQVNKVVLRFRERFWEGLRPDTLAFLHSDAEFFPTWWSAAPAVAPILTGWAGGPAAERVSIVDESEAAERAIDSLSRALSQDRKRLEGLVEESFSHDWRNDPYTRGAYSYVAVGGSGAPGRLAEPIADTLYFAGEATSTEGFQGTIHGALESGERAAAEVLTSNRAPAVR